MQYRVFDLGLVDYQESLEFQRLIFQEILDGKFNAGLILCRHYPVITLGRRAVRGNILAPEEELRRQNIPLVKVERGGDVTYHGPGQLVAYPLVDLQFLKKDIHWFLRCLEGLIIDLLAGYGVSGQRKPGLTGVWVEEGKIASIGIAIRKWISFHGISLNLKSDDLAGFELIRPCGMDIRMTCLEGLLGRLPQEQEIKKNLAEQFSKFLKKGE